MNPYKIAFTFLGLIYTTIALLGLKAAIGVTVVGLAGMMWCSAGWYAAHKYLDT